MAQRLAAVDLGSNSFHLVVADVGGAKGIRRVFKRKDMLLLGRVVAKHSKFDADAMERAVRSMTELTELAKQHGVERAVAVATAAFRDASNTDVLIQKIYDATGVRVEVLTGEEEADLIFDALIARGRVGDRTMLTADLGGGSLELTIGSSQKKYWSTSLPLGVARLTERFIKHDPPTASERVAIGTHVRQSLAPLVEAVAANQPSGLVVSSGSLNDLVRLAWMSEHPRAATVPDEVSASAETVVLLAQHVASSTDEQRQAMPVIDTRRHDLAIAGAVVAEELLRAGFAELHTPELERTVVHNSSWALREGVLLRAHQQSRG
jgi:exopolyphosphatase/guanosine-5'-triphosphate,3'-diphosphate pyrophosphatase